MTEEKIKKRHGWLFLRWLTVLLGIAIVLSVSQNILEGIVNVIGYAIFLVLLNTSTEKITIRKMEEKPKPKCPHCGN